MADTPQPFKFKFKFDKSLIQDLQARLDQTRWPDEVNDDQWTYGVRLSYLRELITYWRHHFDWHAMEARLNALPHYQLELDGLDLHFIHARSPHPNALPLIITHGWPGSIVEFLELIPRLTNPERFGGSAEDAFHVVAPSLQGYGGSSPAQVRGMSPLEIAKRHSRLMARLGYKRYLAQGGDWGSLVTQLTATSDPEHCIGMHLNLVAPIPPADIENPMELVREHEKAWLGKSQDYVNDGMGYYHIQRTRPQTLAYALNDSPVGWCAWVTEKFHAWTDCEREGHRDVRNAVSWDTLLTNISLYWLTGTIASSIRLYREQAQAEATNDSVAVSIPTGVAVYPGEILRSPRDWVEKRYTLVHWHEATHGGHFAAMEQPQIFAEDLWQFRHHF